MKKNKRFSEEYQKALKILDGKAEKKMVKINPAISLMSIPGEAAISHAAGR